jgi:dihydropteroate synthase
LLEYKNFLLWTSQKRRPLVMGVINVTPDSFSDANRFADPLSAAEAAEEMVHAGADWIDIGGESTRPGSIPVPEDEQIRRTAPVIQAIRRRLPVLISIDTTRVGVANVALDCGADVVNDISAGRDDPAIFERVARSNSAIILMHMQGNPQTMQLDPTYNDVTKEVCAFLLERRAAAQASGVDPARILLDPGIGFGKTAGHNLTLLRDIAALAALGSPLVIGPSRKSFIGKITGETDPAKRVFGTAAAVAWCVANGAAVVRVHDVRPMAQVVRMVQAISSAQMPGISG